jgi:hypothetical protein
MSCGGPTKKIKIYNIYRYIQTIIESVLLNVFKRDKWNVWHPKTNQKVAYINNKTKEHVLPNPKFCLWQVQLLHKRGLVCCAENVWYDVCRGHERHYVANVGSKQSLVWGRVLREFYAAYNSKTVEHYRQKYKGYWKVH